MGTHVVSGTANALVVRTGAKTEFGKVLASLRLRLPETEFAAWRAAASRRTCAAFQASSPMRADFKAAA
jgi:magnesium-transporting ATPase (P-type)